MVPYRFVTHSKKVQFIAAKQGWLPGARYTNLRDVKQFSQLGFLDIDWKNYDFDSHLIAAKLTRPYLTVARDVEDVNDLGEILSQADRLSRYASGVIVVPKASQLAEVLCTEIPSKFILGFSVQSQYGGTAIAPKNFRRPVHLLGGRPDQQRKLADIMPVVSFDCNRFTLDAAFGDYFDGETFRPHPVGGYERCLKESVRNINKLWADYPSHKHNVIQKIARRK